MENRKLELAISWPTIVKYFGLLNIFVVVVLAVTHTAFDLEWEVWGLVNGYYACTLTFNKLPLRIIVDRTQGTLVIEYAHFLVSHRIEHTISELIISYEDEARALSVVRKVLKVKGPTGLIIIDLIPDYNGWSKGKIDMIFGALSQS